jgi:hypothetical protein
MGVVSASIIEVGNALPVLEDSLRGELDIDREAVASSSLPPSSGKPTRAHLVEAASRHRSLVRDKQDHERGVVVGLESLYHLLRHDRAGHLCAGIGSNDVDEDVVLLALKSKRLGETKDTALGRGVVGLAEVSVDTASRSGVEDASILLLEHVRPSSLGD